MKIMLSLLNKSKSKRAEVKNKLNQSAFHINS
jgi:hypothetical protein